MKTCINNKMITAAGKYRKAIGLYSAMLHITIVGIAIINNNPKISNNMSVLYNILMVK